MHCHFSFLLAMSLIAVATLGAPFEGIVVKDSDRHWYENLCQKMYTRCAWEHSHEKMKLVQCGNVDKVRKGAAVTGPEVGDYILYNEMNNTEVEKPGFHAHHAEVLAQVPTYHLALLSSGKVQWMNCTTTPQGSGYFGGHNSLCAKKVAFADIPVGSRIIGLGKKKNSTDLPESFPKLLGGEYVGDFVADEPVETFERPVDAIDKREVSALALKDTGAESGHGPVRMPKYTNQEVTGVNFGRYKYLNGTTYLLLFLNQDNYKVTAWEDIPMGSYVYNVGFKSTDDEPEAEIPWVDHCAHISCLACEQKQCKHTYECTVPGTKTERICVSRDQKGMCDGWSKRENDAEGQRRLCEMGKGEFCW